MKTATVIRLVLMLTAIGTFLTPPLPAQPGNTITVQTHTYGSPPRAKFLFPKDTTRFEKILMHYKLRCPFDAQCGEWDYLMYIYLYDHTGIIDSTRDTAYSYTIGGTHPDSLAYMLTPSWRYFPRLQIGVTRTTVTSRDTASVGTGTISSQQPFQSSLRVGRSQYLWQKGELEAAGLKKGNITGMRFNVQTPGSTLRNLTVRMRSTKRDTLSVGLVENDSSLVTLYSRDTKFNAAGWNTIDFPVPFYWNDSSNIAVDISFENATAGGTDNLIMASPANFTSTLAAAADDRSLHFQGRDYIEVPSGAFSGIDSAISIAFWCYGDTAYQPQDNSIIEAADAYGRRVLNIHLPWGDKNIYWDAGNFVGFDRLSKATVPAEYEGRWNFWVFTKNVKSGSMKIYLNGKLWFSGTGKKKPITGISQVKIGSFANGGNNYDGNIDEFAIFNAELDANTIKNWMGGDITSSHPFRSNLKLYYKFQDADLLNAADSSGNGYNGRLTGLPGRTPVIGTELYRNFTTGTLRPNVIFEQGVYTSKYDTTVTVDSLLNDPIQIVHYTNIADPVTPTDTVIGWPASYRYSFNKLGQATDTTRIAPDSVLHLVKTPYMRKFEIVNRYEIGRYITPYGNGLSLGEGFDWVFDVSDYRPLLHDSVDIEAYNQQEMVDLSFEMVKGIPPRDPIAVRNLWNGGFSYGTSDPIENHLKSMKVKIPANAANSRIKIRPTGHGFQGNENCAEFCPKDHSITVDGTERFRRTVWRDNCGLNPVYPQGGTWVYNRTNWCPGAEVWTYDFELSPYVTAGDSVALDYNIDPYTWNGQGSQPYYQIETQLISYGAPNFSNDASIEEIKSPSKTDLYRRMNPICSRPIVTIRNTGSSPLTSLTITYGIVGAEQQSVYHWTGKLDFMESTDVELGEFGWLPGNHAFRVTVSEPNGLADQYANNNMKESVAEFPPQYPSQLVLELKTNNSGEETSYQVKDAAGTMIFEKKDLAAATLYRDTLNLPEGCYEFRLNDAGGDGLNWWANPDAGAGTMRIRSGAGATLKTFNADFGSEIYQQFYVGQYIPSDVPETGTASGSESRMDVFPNPTKGELTLDLTLPRVADVAISVHNLLGVEVYHSLLKHAGSGRFTIDLGAVPAGVYVISARTDDGVLSRKIVVE